MQRWRYGLYALFILSLLWSFVIAPDDKFLKSTERIFYIHFAAAVTFAVAYFASWIAAIAYLMRRELRFDRLSAASAEVGTLLATVVLVSGSIWARVAWNTWWTWDPKLITTAVLWFLYVGYFVMRGLMAEDPNRRALYSAVFALFAFLDVPIVFASSRWWATIHPVVITDTSINVAPSMLPAMFLFLFAMLGFGLDLLYLRVRQMSAETRLERLKARLRAGV